MNLRSKLATQSDFNIGQRVCWLDGEDNLFTGTIVEVDRTNKWYAVSCDQYGHLQLSVVFVPYDRDNRLMNHRLTPLSEVN